MYTYAAKLIEVIDGDTVDLLIDLGFGVHVKERCRLYGIDAPEMPTAQGQAAKAYLESLLGAATGDLHVQTIKMTRKPKERTDKYGRYLAVLYDGISGMEDDEENAAEQKIPNMLWSSINRRMIQMGHAKERYW